MLAHAYIHAKAHVSPLESPLKNWTLKVVREIWCKPGSATWAKMCAAAYIAHRRVIYPIKIGYNADKRVGKNRLRTHTPAPCALFHRKRTDFSLAAGSCYFALFTAEISRRMVCIERRPIHMAANVSHVSRAHLFASHNERWFIKLRYDIRLCLSIWRLHRSPASHSSAPTSYTTHKTPNSF